MGYRRSLIWCGLVRADQSNNAHFYSFWHSCFSISPLLHIATLMQALLRLFVACVKLIHLGCCPSLTWPNRRLVFSFLLLDFTVSRSNNS